MFAAIVKPLCRTGRIALLWLLAWLVPLQCSASVMRLAAGPAHGHASAAPAAPASELRDFRRQPLPGLHAHADTGSAHRHAPGTRHHHAADDATVIAGDSGLDRLDAQDEGTGAAVAPLIPLVLSGLVWHAPSAVHAAPDGPARSAASQPSARLERPPRSERT